MTSLAEAEERARIRARHPAKFTDTILDVLAGALAALVLDADVLPLAVLDPFAGTGRIHTLAGRVVGIETTGIELEPEWAALDARTRIGNALVLPTAWVDCFDAVVTSPVYGNRMSDHHDARDNSDRITYRHRLGRPLSAENAGALQWGAQYRAFHEQAWREALRVLRPGGAFILNISDHIRGKVQQPVSHWHASAAIAAGFEFVGGEKIPTPRNRYGANAELRVENEWVLYFLKPVR